MDGKCKNQDRGIIWNAEFRTKRKLKTKPEIQFFLKVPGVFPVFFLKAMYIADLDLKPESVPIPSIER